MQAATTIPVPAPASKKALGGGAIAGIAIGAGAGIALIAGTALSSITSWLSMHSFFKVLVNVARLFQHVHHIEFGRHGVTGLGFGGLGVTKV